jgi:hypothetical protein
MSSNVGTSRLRLKIESLTGANGREAYLFFKEKIGEPDDFYDYGDDEVDFHYKGEKNYYAANNFGDNWYADFVFYEKRDYYDEEYFSISFKDFKKRAKKLVKKFGGKIEDVKVCSYTWYNGSDEPEVF